MEHTISTKPYLIRALHEWCMDNNLTPHLIVAVNTQTRVPMAYVREGEIVLNINYSATKDLHIDNNAVVFSARFGGIPQNIYIPIGAVKGIFARENGQGMFFEVEVSENQASELPENASENVKKQEISKKPTLTIVK